MSAPRAESVAGTCQECLEAARARGDVYPHGGAESVIGARFEFLGAARAHGGASFPATPCANKSWQEFWELHGCSARKKASPT